MTDPISSKLTILYLKQHIVVQVLRKALVLNLQYFI